MYLPVLCYELILLFGCSNTSNVVLNTTLVRNLIIHSIII
jgi:hypothetical protein